MQPIFTTYEKAIIKITKRREKGRKKVGFVDLFYFLFLHRWLGWKLFQGVKKVFCGWKIKFAKSAYFDSKFVIIQNPSIEIINVAGFLKNDWFQNVHKG